MKANYICSNCGSIFTKWFGKCPECGEWNTLEESAVAVEDKSTKKSKIVKTFTAPSTSKAQRISDITFQSHIRFSTGLNEFDRVLGGGVVKGSAVLLSGEPGIGKSTLLLQICEKIGEFGKILYISGEESSSQIKLRAQRLGVNNDNLYVLCETNINKAIPEAEGNAPDLVIVDSVQTMYDDELQSVPGSITQVKQTAMMFIRSAKENNYSVIFVGHVNKDGAIAGPKVLEHIVDAVLYFEGDKQHSYRIIRAEKNRFGSTNEIGVFEMGDEGLIEVENPSEALLSQRPSSVPGNCAVCIMEGTRPILSEVQALASQTSFPVPRRVTNGYDYNRLNMLLAVLEKRMGLRFSASDVYINVIGGLRLEEPSCDLAVAMALISSIKELPMPEDMIAIGEIGLSGECRSVSHSELRINEAKRLGFQTIALPYFLVPRLKNKYKGINIVPIRSLFDAINLLK